MATKSASTANGMATSNTKTLLKTFNLSCSSRIALPYCLCTGFNRRHTKDFEPTPATRSGLYSLLYYFSCILELHYEFNDAVFPHSIRLH